MEIWKEVLGYEGIYEVSSLGRVKSIKFGKIKYLVLRTTTQGYFAVRLFIKGKSKTIKVHRLVAISFIENKNNKPQVNHIDGDKKNNNILNLEWNTAKENSEHAFRTGLNFREIGEKSKASKLTNKDVLFIRSLEKPNKKELSKNYNVDLSVIYNVINRKVWKHI